MRRISKVILISNGWHMRRGNKLGQDFLKKRLYYVIYQYRSSVESGSSNSVRSMQTAYVRWIIEITIQLQKK